MSETGNGTGASRAATMMTTTRSRRYPDQRFDAVTGPGADG